MRTRLLAFWDNAVVGVKYREGFVHKVYNSERGIGAPGKPVNRRDKNMRAWYLTVARHFLYLLDAINLRRVVAREKESGPDVIILDRYIYDEILNLNMANPVSRALVRLVHAFIPRPDIAYLLDADPAAAYARKPEYPPEFMEESRQAYFKLANVLGTMTLIPAGTLAEVANAVLKVAETKLPAGNREQGLGNSRPKTTAQDPENVNAA
ncbi:MAG TPA: thymidylate kinase [Candidatus Angelobacter sp.]